MPNKFLPTCTYSSRRAFFIFLLSLFTLNAELITLSYSQTPDWAWARCGGNPGQSGTNGWSIATDNANNVFVTGQYIDTISFGSYLLTGNRNVFLAKYDMNGAVKWAATAEGGMGYGRGVATDVYGNCYVTGYFTDTVSFGSDTLISTGSVDVFLVKYDSSGAVQWAQRAGGLHAQYSYGVDTD